MSEQESTEHTDKFKQAAANCADFHSQAGKRIVAHPDETWRPDGVCVSEPLGFRETESVAREAINQLARLSDVWQRNGALVRVLESDVYLGKDGTGKAKTGSALAIRELDLPMITAVMCQATKFWKYNGTKDGQHQWERVEPSGKIVKLVQSLGYYPRSPVLKGIVQSPAMRADGSILCSPGYDDQTCWFFKPNFEFLAVPDQPTKEQVNVSVKCLAEPFAAHQGYDSFPFVSDAHRWLPIALAMSLLVRPAIDGCVPLFGFDATDAGTGKGMACDVASVIATGQVAAKSTFPATPEELEKVLSSHAIAGSQLICFDNISGVVRGDALEKIATTPVVEFRILGRSEILKLPWHSVVAFTGNQLSFHGDTARRVVSCRQESPVELPSRRSNFKHADLIGWVKKNRAYLVRSALTVLRAYVLSGDTQSKETVKGFGSFGNWATLVPAAIHWATGVNVLECRLNLETADPLREAEVNLLRAIRVLQDMKQANGFTTKQIIDLAYQDEIISYAPMTRGPVYPELREAFDALITSHSKDLKNRPSAISVGRMLERRRNAVRGGLRLVSSINRLANVQEWSVENV